MIHFPDSKPKPPTLQISDYGLKVKVCVLTTLICAAIVVATRAHLDWVRILMAGKYTRSSGGCTLNNLLNCTKHVFESGW